jgi:HSP20 family molecular chaperone IbpA
MIVRRYPTFSLNSGQIDRVFSELANSFSDTPAFGPSMRADFNDEGEYVLTVDLPGVPAEAVSVEVTGNTLRLAAMSNDAEWSRTLRIGGSLDPEKITARHVDGRLTVKIGKVDQPEARRVEIATSPEQQSLSQANADAIDSTSSDTAQTEQAKQAEQGSEAYSEANSQA